MRNCSPSSCIFNDLLTVNNLEQYSPLVYRREVVRGVSGTRCSNLFTFPKLLKTLDRDEQFRSRWSQ